MKNVLLLVHEDNGQEARFQAAVDITRALEGHLTCVDIVPFTPIPGDAYGLADGGVMLMQAEREIETLNRTRLEKRLEIEGLNWDWIELIGNFEAALEDSATLADVIVVNREVSDLAVRDIRRIAEPLVVRSGKPIVAAVNEDGFNVAGRALVAWDGSDPCSAAVQAAVPLLKLSESVTLLELDDETVGNPAEMAAAYLSRHGIHAEIARLDVPTSDFVEPVLLSKLESGHYDWLVMGAFSKSRVRETFFGGVTKRLLKESPLPLFIAH
jgi:nucleotide-binding universal stress UspA family protein